MITRFDGGVNASPGLFKLITKKLKADRTQCEQYAFCLFPVVAIFVLYFM